MPQPQPYECPVCLEEIPKTQNSTYLKCGHQLHSTCLLELIASKTNAPDTHTNHIQCPLCRETLITLPGKPHTSPHPEHIILIDDALLLHHPPPSASQTHRQQPNLAAIGGTLIGGVLLYVLLSYHTFFLNNAP